MNEEAIIKEWAQNVIGDLPAEIVSSPNNFFSFFIDRLTGSYWVNIAGFRTNGQGQWYFMLFDCGLGKYATAKKVYLKDPEAAEKLSAHMNEVLSFKGKRRDPHPYHGTVVRPQNH